MLTRKHYVAIAEVVAETRCLALKDVPLVAMGIMRACDEISDLLADRFSEENPRFDRNRFLSACGFGES